MLGRSPLMMAAGASSYKYFVEEYLGRVRTADLGAGNSLWLERSVTDAISVLLEGLVSDGLLGLAGTPPILSASASLIKCGCLIMGARTLPGALVPLASNMPAPTNYNFVSADYDRKTGLIGNGTTKYLNTGHNMNSVGLDDQSFSVYVTALPTTGIAIGGGGIDGNGSTNITYSSATTTTTTRSRTQVASSAVGVPTTPFFGISRSAAASYTRRISGASTVISTPSQTLMNRDITLFALGYVGQPVSIYANPRIAFYHGGRAFDTAILEARITTFANAIAAAIP